VFSNAPAPTERYPLSLHDALPIYAGRGAARHRVGLARARTAPWAPDPPARLDLLAVRGAALRDAGARAVRPRRDRVVRRLRPRARSAAAGAPGRAGGGRCRRLHDGAARERGAGTARPRAARPRLRPL